MPRLVDGLEQVFTNLGIVGSGYKLFFFEFDTTTPATTYSNEGLTIANPNPVVCDAAGRPEHDIWGDNPANYKLILGTPDSVIGNINPIVTLNPIDNISSNSIINIDPIPTAYWGATTGTSSAYVLNPALVPITSYSNKQCFFVDFHVACSAAPVININAIGELALKKYTGQGTKVALLAADVQVQRHLCIMDGVDCVVLNPVSAAFYSGPPATLTISSGAIAITNVGSNYLVATEGGASTDDLTDITGGLGGEIIILQSADSTKDVVIKNSGNILTATGQDFTLSTTTDKIGFQYRSSDSKWVELFRNRVTPAAYISPPQTITLSGALTLAHGLGRAPDLLTWLMKCTSTDGGYAVDDVVFANPMMPATGSTVTFGVSVVPDATNLSIRMSDTTPQIINKGTGAAHGIDITKWKYIFKAYLLDNT